jgi:hypothetical protein
MAVNLTFLLAGSSQEGDRARADYQDEREERCEGQTTWRRNQVTSLYDLPVPNTQILRDQHYYFVL